jgi:hypothetical protein
MDMTNATVVLKMDGIGLLSKDAVQSYGNAQIEKLLDHFSQNHEEFEPVVDRESTIAEWKLVKQVVFEHKHLYANESMKALWQQLIHAHKGTFPQMTRLAQMALIFPLQTATCERVFSVQNNIITIKRNRLQESTTQRLMKVKLNGSPLSEFNYLVALQAWRAENNRKIFHNN